MMRGHCSTLAETKEEVEAVLLGDKQGEVQAMVDTLVDTLEEVEGSDTWRLTGRCART